MSNESLDAVGPLLEIYDLGIAFGTQAAVHDVSLSVGPREVVGVIGESGSGKSLTCRAVLRIVPSGGQIVKGAIRFDSRDVLGMSKKELRHLRARDVGMIFQDPFSSLNPTLRIGRQLIETLRVNAGLSQAAARDRAVDLLTQVEIPDPEARLRSYPYEMSGGQRQRVMIAIALAADPRLLIADEPTTALDVSTQAQVLKLLKRLRQDREMSVLLVSHDFGVIAEMCDRVVVMYGGFVVEVGTIEEVSANPIHPYTRALLDAVPILHPEPGDRRRGIPGPPLGTIPYVGGCPFEPRCAFARAECRTIDMSLRPVSATRACACPFVDAVSAEPLGEALS
jgi:oligopeptide/dipeptide ABC transporter ATP-binding protein